MEDYTLVMDGRPVDYMMEGTKKIQGSPQSIQSS